MIAATSVLVADDDADIRVLVSTILTRAGFHAEAVDGGVPALAAAQREAHHVFVLDIRMPDLSGLEVCRRLKADVETASSPVLLMSAESSTEDVAAAYAAGCDDYLSKPFTASELVHRVDQLLARC